MPLHHVTLSCFAFNNIKMTIMQTCEVRATLAPLNVEPEIVCGDVFENYAAFIGLFAFF